jgi:DNA-binding CsgD family transcriptional regulator
VEPPDTEEISTKLLERSLRESLTPTQYGIYQACILNGISYKAYADRMDVSYQSVQNAIRLIQKKAKNIFG